MYEITLEEIHTCFFVFHLSLFVTNNDLSEITEMMKETRVNLNTGITLSFVGVTCLYTGTVLFPAHITARFRHTVYLCTYLCSGFWF